jgi:hypothetical protein
MSTLNSLLIKRFKHISVLWRYVLCSAWILMPQLQAHPQRLRVNHIRLQSVHIVANLPASKYTAVGVVYVTLQIYQSYG